MNLFDVHAHLDMKDFDEDRDQVIKSCSEKGVTIINNGLGEESNRATVELSKAHDNVLPALGVYPSEAVEMSEEKLEEELRFIEDNSPVAIGEVGLDYKYDYPKEEQLSVFRKMLGLAERLGVPVIVHSRRAEKDVLKVLKEFSVKAVMHCFSGSAEQVMLGVRQGYLFSVPPRIITSESFQELVKTLPLENLLLETDSPFMGVRKGARNHPTNIFKTVSKVSGVKGVTELEVIEAVKSNQKIFRQT